MNELLRICLIACPLVFLGGFVDSIAGGGGIITIPAYLLAGMPTYLALGTNKLVAMVGTSAASVKYFRSGKVVLRIAVPAAIGSLLGSLVGTRLALLIPEQALRIVLLVALPLVAVFLIRKKDFGKNDESDGQKNELKEGGIAALSAESLRKDILMASVIGLGIGLYDGLIGPGTGTFFIMAFTAAFGTDLLTSSGCAKIANLASNVMSAIVYLFAGKVWYLVAVIAMVFNVAGNLAGTRYALKGGSQNVRKIMFVVLGLLFVRVILEILGIVS